MAQVYSRTFTNNTLFVMKATYTLYLHFTLTINLLTQITKKVIYSWLSYELGTIVGELIGRNKLIVLSYSGSSCRSNVHLHFNPSAGSDRGSLAC